MQPDLLQQLRDIHLPPEPGWWPPAPGWWLLALLLAVALIYLAHRVRQGVARRRPIRLARQCYETLYARYQRGDIDAADFLHQANELLKRLYVHGLHDDDARRANDAAWLAYLDAHGGGSAFTRGPGRQLGNQRFAPEPEADPRALDPLIRRLLRVARP